MVRATPCGVDHEGDVCRIHEVVTVEIERADEEAKAKFGLLLAILPTVGGQFSSVDFRSRRKHERMD